MYLKIKIINIAKKYPFFRKICRFLLFTFKRAQYIMYYLRYKVNDNLIFFEAYDGNSYSCSPKAIYEYMTASKKYNNYTFVWAFKEPDMYKSKLTENTIIVKSNSKEYYKYLSMSKYWIINFLLNISVIKKKKQVYVQCWHGTPLKKLRYDIEVNGAALNDLKEIRKRNDLDVKRIDYFLSPSKYSSDKFISAFNLKALNKENIILEKGYPRNDYLYNFDKQDINKIKSSIGIDKEKKVILYAPTFRDNQHTSGIGYTYNLGINFDELAVLADNYIILFRTHYFITNLFDFNKYKGFVYDVSNYDDINELYLISDILITDYSSVFFDFANLKKPIIFYMYDLDEYKNHLRNFYIDIKLLPGKIVRNEQELLKEIKNVEISFYDKKYENFNKKFNYLEDGKASERVVKVIFDEKDKENV